MNNKILDVIVDAVLSDRLNWNRPWSVIAAHNHITGKVYRGVNQYLNFIGEKFITFNQIKKLGGNLKKGSKGFPVVYALIEKDILTDEIKKFSGHRYYTVFDLNDVEGIDFDTVERVINIQNEVQNDLDVLNQYMSKENLVIYRGDPAYSPSQDVLYMPEIKEFVSAEAYTAALAHECIHSTGHDKRTKRHSSKVGFTDHRFGSNTYAKEELVAELGAVILTGNRLLDLHTAYIQSWIRGLGQEGKKQEIFDAFQLAQKAVDYIKGNFILNQED